MEKVAADNGFLCSLVQYSQEKCSLILLFRCLYLKQSARTGGIGRYLLEDTTQSVISPVIIIFFHPPISVCFIYRMFSMAV